MAKYNACSSLRRVHDKGGSFKFGLNQEPLKIGYIGNSQNIGAAANLAIFDIVLAAPCGPIDDRLIPFTAAGALETRFHDDILDWPAENTSPRRTQRAREGVRIPGVPRVHGGSVWLTRGSRLTGGAGVRFADGIA
jgi:hypothetical protein